MMIKIKNVIHLNSSTFTHLNVVRRHKKILEKKNTKVDLDV